MTSSLTAYIAGVGLSPLPSRTSPAKQTVRALVSAATKALLDAGVTYDDVTRGVTNLKSKDFGDASLPFKAFDSIAIAVDEVEDDLELETAVHKVQAGEAQCVLLIATRKSSAIALVIVAETFLWRHPYLKDSAVVLHKPVSSEHVTDSQAQTRLHSVCHTVWTLRGWTKPQGSMKQNTFVFSETRSNHSFELGRADGKDIPKFEEVEHRQDGKHRLGYNPAAETKEVSHEDFEAVRAEKTSSWKTVEEPSYDRKGGDRAALAKL